MHGDVYSIQPYVTQYINDLYKVGYFFLVYLHQ